MSEVITEQSTNKTYSANTLYFMMPGVITEKSTNKTYSVNTLYFIMPEVITEQSTIKIFLVRTNFHDARHHNKTISLTKSAQHFLRT